MTFVVSDMKRKPCVFPETAEGGGPDRPGAQGSLVGGTAQMWGRVAAGGAWSLARDQTGMQTHVTLAVTQLSGRRYARRPFAARVSVHVCP